MKYIISVIILFLLYFHFGCSSSAPEDFRTKIYLPTEKEGVFSYFINGLPFGCYSNDTSENVIFCMDETGFSGNKYYRLWILYQSNLTEHYLFDPLKSVFVQLKRYDGSNIKFYPESPSKILSDIENTKQEEIIIQTIGYAFKSVAINLKETNTEITETSNINIDRKTYMYNDKNEKIESKMETNSAIYYNNVNNINNWYSLFQSSINNGLLKKNTVFPNYSINGYIYFLKKGEKNLKKDRFDISTYDDNIRKDENYSDTKFKEIILHIITKNGEKQINLSPSYTD